MGPDLSGHVYHIDWYDRATCDQLQGYTYGSEHSEDCSAAAGWTEHLETVEPCGLEMRWWIYSGRGCAPDRKAPLIVSLHEFHQTCWGRIADREGLGVLAFEYHRNMVWVDDSPMMEEPTEAEISGFLTVIEATAKNLNCDPSRIYLEALSYGSMLASLIAKQRPKLFAAMAVANGPMCAANLMRMDLFRHVDGALPVLMINSDDDVTSDGFCPGINILPDANEAEIRMLRIKTARMNRDIWIRQNGLDPSSAEITTAGKRTFLRYPGEQTEVMFGEFALKSHMLSPATSEIIWELLFRRYRRESDGATACVAPTPAADYPAVAAMLGYSTILVNSRKAELGAPCILLAPYAELNENAAAYCKTECSYASIYAPVEILELGFGASNVTYRKNEQQYSQLSESSRDAQIELEDGVIAFCHQGHAYQMMTNTTVACVDGQYRDMERPALLVNGHMMLPLKETAELLGLYCDQCDGAIYLCDHPVKLGHGLPLFLKEELLVDGAAPRRYRVRAKKSGSCEIRLAETEIEEGEALEFELAPSDPDAVLCSMGGVPIKARRIGEHRFRLENVMADVTVESPVADGDNGNGDAKAL